MNSNNQLENQFDGMVLVVDCRNRQMNVCAASVTCMDENRTCLVLRKAVDVCTIVELVGQTLGVPILLLGRYSAQSSEGFAHPLVGGDDFKAVQVVGGIGFGKKLNTGLRCFSEPIEGILLPPETMVEKIWTHSNSNPSTASAAYKGLRLRAVLQKKVLLAEGQSDTTNAFEFVLQRAKEHPEIPLEHNVGIISLAGIFDSAVGRRSAWNSGHTAIDYARMDLEFRVDGSSEVALGLPEKVRSLIPGDQVRHIVHEKLSAYIAAGWKFGLKNTSGETFNMVSVSPENVETVGYQVEPEKQESLLDLDTCNTDDEKKKLRTKIRSVRIGNFFCDLSPGQRGQQCDYLAVVQFSDGTSYSGWFSHDATRLGPSGEVPVGNHFLGLFVPDRLCPRANSEKLWGETFSGRILEITTVEVTAYDNKGNVINSCHHKVNSTVREVLAV